MKSSIETLLINVIRTQAEFEAAKTALYLAKLEQQRAAQWTEAEAREFGDYRSNEEMAAHYSKEGHA